MLVKRVIIGTVVGTLAVAAAFAVPALGAPEAAKRLISQSGSTFFTPSSADPKLAALVARNGLDNAPFRFTPSESRGQRRPLEPLQRTPKTGVVSLRVMPTLGTTTVAVAPITYDITRTAPAKRLVLPNDTKVDLAGLGRKPIDIGTSFSVRRSPNKLKATADKVSAADARLAGTGPKDMIDVGGSYSLTRNIDVTAGVRYKAQDRDRLAPLPDGQRDSQAVYVGTAFRF